MKVSENIFDYYEYDRFHSLVENIPDNIIRLDIQGRYLYINKAHRERLQHLLNIDAKNLIGKKVEELFSHETIKIIAIIEQIMATKQAVTLQKQPFPNKNGAMEIHDVTFIPEFNDENEVISILGIGYDSTQSYHVQDELAAREQELRMITESSPGMVGSFYMRPDNSLCMPYVSSNIFELYGICPEDVKEDAMPLLSLNHPDDVAGILDSIAESARTMTIWHHEYRTIHPTKGIRWMESNTKPVTHPDGGVIWYGYVHDITERKNTQMKLAKQEKMFRTLTENTKDIIIRYDLNCQKTYLNPRAEELFGKKKEELLGKRPSIFSLIPASMNFESKLRQVIASGKALEINASYVKSNGEEGWGSNHILPEFGEDGKVISVLVIGRDLTEIRHKERLLVEKERLFRTLVEQSPDTIAMYDKECIRTYVNPAFAVAAGVNAKALLGKKPTSIKNSNMQEYETKLSNAMMYDREEEMELVWVNKKGKSITHHIRIVPEKEKDGTVLSAFTAGHDITHLKETERKLIENEKNLKEAQRIAKIGSWELDYSTNRLSWSDEAYRIFDLTPLEMLPSYEAYIKFLHPDDREQVEDEFRFSIQNKKQYNSIHRILTRADEVKYIRALAETQYNAHGTPIYSRGTVQDITEQKMTEQKMELQERQLVMQSRLAQMGEVLSMIAHQWRQPLGAIASTIATIQTKLQSEELTYKYIPSPQEEYLDKRLERINSYVEHLALTIDEFRRFFKPDKKRSIFSLSEAMEKAIYLLSGSYTNHNINIERIYHTQGKIESYENELIQAFMSLLGNAKDVLIERHIVPAKVYIELRSVENLYILTFGDNAGGIDEKDIDKVFDPYFSTKANTGTGLGLYMSKIIIETHCHGNMMVENSDKGALFSIILPQKS